VGIDDGDRGAEPLRLQRGDDMVDQALSIGVAEDGPGGQRRLLQRIWLRRTALRSRADTTAASSTRWVW